MGPHHEYPERDLGSWFEEVARERGDAVAVVCEAESVTYAELNRRANREARWLRERGVGPEVRVGCAANARSVSWWECWRS